MKKMIMAIATLMMVFAFANTAHAEHLTGYDAGYFMAKILNEDMAIAAEEKGFDYKIDVVEIDDDRYCTLTTMYIGDNVYEEYRYVTGLELDTERYLAATWEDSYGRFYINDEEYNYGEYVTLMKYDLNEKTEI